MQTTTFVTQYEGPRKIHMLVEYPLICMLSSLGSDFSSEQSEQTLKKIKNEILGLNKTPEVFDIKTIVTSYVDELDVALVYVADGEVFFVTHGTGIVFVRRGGQVRQVVADGLFAKGTAKDGDEYIATTSEYLDFVGGMDGFSYYFGRYKSSEVSEMMETYEDQSSPSGFVAMHIGEESEDDESGSVDDKSISTENTHQETSELIIQEKIHVENESDGELVEEVLSQNPVTKNASINNLFIKIKRVTSRENIHKAKFIFSRASMSLQSIKSLGPKKLIIIGVSLIVFSVILKSIPYGEIFKNRDEDFAKFEKKINAYLDEADTLAFEDMSEVSIVLQKARDEIEVLSDSDKRYFADKLKNIGVLIDEKENSLLKVSKSKLKEHYSLSLLGKNINVTDVDTDGERFYILDSVNGAYYAIPTQKISQEIVRSDKMKNALQIAAYEGRVYVLTKNDGIYRIEKSKSVQVVKAANAWGKIVDMKLYASNIYLLDSERGDIYKYPGISEDEFGTMTSYLVEETRGTLKGASQMVIAGPIYVVGESQVAKYVTGRREDFVLKIPYKDGSISNFAASPDNKSFYVFDDAYSAVYIYGEDVILERQFKEKSLKNSKSIFATEDNVFVVTQNSVLTLPEK